MTFDPLQAYSELRLLGIENNYLRGLDLTEVGEGLGEFMKMCVRSDYYLGCLYSISP